MTRSSGAGGQDQGARDLSGSGAVQPWPLRQSQRPALVVRDAARPDPVGRVHPGMQVPIRWVLVRDPEGEKEPQAFLCTDLDADPVDILRWFVRRWRVETTFEEARRHLGLETQRQWSDLAILRTTPALLGLISLVTLWATQLEAAQGLLPECVRW